MKDLHRLYCERFGEEARAARNRLWRVLCEDFFQGFVPDDGTVLDLACGFGELSRHIRAAHRIGVDLNPEMGRFLGSDIRFICTSADDLSMIDPGSVDVCFTSNFFEHLPDKPAMDRVLQEVLRVLVPGGRFVALQPNIKYLASAYWDFYDHLLPLSHLSAAEGFIKSGFEVERLIPRFLPYTTKSALPQHPLLVRLYLKLPLAWRVLGRQFLIVGRKARETAEPAP